MDYLNTLIGLAVEDAEIGGAAWLKFTFSGNSQECTLRTWGCGWQIFGVEDFIAGSFDEEIDWESVKERLLACHVARVSLEPQTMSLRITLDNGVVISVLPLESRADIELADDGDNSSEDWRYQWSYHPPGDSHFAANGGGKWSIRKNETSGRN